MRRICAVLAAFSLTLSFLVGASSSALAGPKRPDSRDTSLQEQADVAFRSTAGFNANTTNAQVTVPADVSAGDGLVLFVTVNSSTATLTLPAGWDLVQRATEDGIQSLVLQRVATADDPGATVSVGLSGFAKTDLRLLAYQGTHSSSPVTAAAHSIELTSSATHTTPELGVSRAGSWLVSYWADKSPTTAAWTPPTGVSVRAETYGTGAGHITTLVADSGGRLSAGTYGGLVATADTAANRAATWTVALSPATQGGPCAYPTITGTAGNDTLTGTSGDDIIDAGDGDDTVNGGDGDDVICGGNGVDNLNGNAGNDRAYGQAGNDTIDGGAGTDFLDGGADNDNCSRGETWTSCEYPGSDQVAVEGSRGTKVVVQSDEELPPWKVRVEPDYGRNQIALGKQASFAFDISLEPGTTFTSATVTIPYIPQALKGTDPADLRIYHLDSDSGLWVPAAETQTVDTTAHTVTAQVNHFSTFSIFRGGPGFESYWDSKPVWCVPSGDPAAPHLDIAFVIDQSGSMSTSDPNGLRVDGAKQFIDSMNAADRATVVGFSDTATRYIGLTDLGTSANVTAVKNALEQTRAPAGGTNITAAVRAGTAELVAGASAGRPRIALLLTDGQSTYDTTATTEARDANVVYHTIGLGADVDETVLQGIADGTSGTYRLLSSADQLPGLYAELSRDLIDPGTDTDADGLTDCVERKGALVASGFYAPESTQFPDRYVTTDPNDPDTDNDGLSDGAEMGPVHDLRTNPLVAEIYGFLIDAGIVQFWNPTSDPTKTDTDGEGLDDQEEVGVGTNAFLFDTDFDTATDYEEVQYGLDPTSYDSLFPKGIGVPGISPLTLARPEPNQYPWPFVELVWDPSSGDCGAGACPELIQWAQQQFDDKGEFAQFFCSLFDNCQPDDLRKEWIKRTVAEQGFFTEDGYLTDDIVLNEWIEQCVAVAVQPDECYTVDAQQRIASKDHHWQNLTEAIVDALLDLPGGTRPRDNDVDEAKAKLQNLAEQACDQITRLPDETAQAWGRRVHQRFNDLVRNSGDPTLFGETGYLDGQVVSRGPGNAWPKGTTAPDAGFGTPLNPRALFDLKTGEKGILPSWLDRLEKNLKGIATGVPVHKLTC